MSDVTQLLNALGAGDSEAAARLLPAVYRELRQLAAAQVARETPGQTLDATALVHEAWLRLIPGGRPLAWESRRHFFKAAAVAMRHIMVDVARKKARIKRGGAVSRVALADVSAPESDLELLGLDEGLDRLAVEDPIAARVVELRFFCGLGHDAVADTLGISVYQARQKWTYARAWLRQAVTNG